MEENGKSAKVFIHGLESSSRGTKGAFFREKHPDMIVEDFFGTFDQRMAKLDSLLVGKKDLILVGSSYGGLMATVFALLNKEKVKKMVLLAPALDHMPLEMRKINRLSIPVTIYHGSRDDVVPAGEVHEIARKLFTGLTWSLVDDDHPLHKTFLNLNWDDLLS